MTATSNGFAPRVCLMGASLDNGNRGVAALAAASIGNLLRVWPNAQIFLFLGCPAGGPQRLKVAGREVQIPVLNYRMALRVRLQEHLLWLLLMGVLHRLLPWSAGKVWLRRRHSRLQALWEADWVGDIRGGDSFSDIYGLRRFILGSLPVLLVILLGRKPVLLPQTIGPFKSRTSQWLAGLICRRARTILVRDRESLPIAVGLARATNQNGKVAFCPDVAFTLESWLPQAVSIKPPIPRDAGKPIIGLNVSGLLYNGGYTRANMFGLKGDYKSFVHGLVRRLMIETDAQVLLIPHTFAPPGNINSDPEACQRIVGELGAQHGSRLHLVSETYSQEEIKGVIGLCEILIGSRMHACIGALSQGIPAIGIAYSRKFAGVFESVGMGDAVVDARELGETALQDRVLEIYHKRAAIAVQLATQVQNIRAQVLRTFDTMAVAGTGTSRASAISSAPTCGRQ